MTRKETHVNRLPTSRTVKLLVGALALTFAATAVLAVGLLRGGDQGPVRVTAHFEDAVGLYAGNAVSVLGMQVGEVTSVVPKNDFVEVKMEIDPDVAIPADVQAVTVSTSILTDRHVELTPPYKSGPTLADQDVLSLPRTRTPVEFDRTLAMADKLARSLSGDEAGQGPLADLVAIGARIASGSGEDVKSALDQLSQALRLSSDNGTATRENIQTIADSLSVLTESAAANDTAIRDFGSQIRQLSQIVADQNLGSGDAGAQLNQILDQAATLLENNRGRLKPALTDVETLTRTMADSKRELSETLNLLPMVGTNVYTAIDQSFGAMRVHAHVDKILLDGQITKEICNLAGIKDLGCNTGTALDYSPGYGTKFFIDGMMGMLQNMAGPKP